MNAGFNENEAKFTVLVLAVPLKMFADGDGLASVSSICPILTDSERKGDNDGMLPS